MKLNQTLVLALLVSSLSVVSCSSKEAKSDEPVMSSEAAAPAATPVAAEPANLGKSSSGQGR